MDERARYSGPHNSVGSGTCVCQCDGASSWKNGDLRQLSDKTCVTAGKILVCLWCVLSQQAGFFFMLENKTTN